MNNMVSFRNLNCILTCKIDILHVVQYLSYIFSKYVYKLKGITNRFLNKI